MLERKLELCFILAVVSMLLMTLFIYSPGMGGPFVFDDAQNLEPLGSSGGVDSLDDAQRFIFGNESGPTGRPVSMASFLLDDSSWPAASSASFKKTNLALHLVTGLMVFLVAFRVILYLFPDRNVHALSVGFVTMAFWLVHPLNTSTVLYVVQRMAILSALFSLASMYLYFCFRGKAVSREVPRYFLLLLSLVLLVLGFFSKENALLVVVFILGFEIYLRKERLQMGGRSKYLLLLLTASAFIYIIFETYEIWGRSYQNREFDISDRLISQLVAIGEYLRKIIFPQASHINLFRGEFENYPTVPFDSMVWLNGVFSMLLFFCLGFLSFSKKSPHKSAIWLGFFWFISFHLIESTILPLELYFEHRNYLPSVGIILCVAFLLSVAKIPQYMKVFVAASVIIFCSFQTFYLAKTWGTPDQLFLKWEMDEPKSVRAKVSYAHFLYSKGFPENSVEFIEDAMVYAPNSMMLKFHYLFYSCVPETKVSHKSALDKFKEDSIFDLGVSIMLSQFLDKLLNKEFPGCSEDNINVVEIFDYVESSKNFGYHKNHTVQYYDLKSDYYVKKGNLNGAVTALDKAISLAPQNHALYVKSADILASAGLYSLAVKRLKKSLSVDMKGWKKFNSRTQEIKSRINAFERQEARL
ncbi:hypothetical protein [uncultured Marinobacter sp.]|uniref:tetratricopeptide repeat protein n=1 Tax=uncultured Marinobacter sp. TaxID=187379 RepID=UPI002601C6FF|nr:hypothetical protein [uncultured Marinobacter sp.]